MPPVAILDVDGTLVDTNYQHALAWFRAFRQHGVVLPIWRIHRHMGMGGDQLVASVAGGDVERDLGDDIRAAISICSTHGISQTPGRASHRQPRGGARVQRCAARGEVSELA